MMYETAACPPVGSHVHYCCWQSENAQMLSKGGPTVLENPSFQVLQVEESPRGPDPGGVPLNQLFVPEVVRTHTHYSSFGGSSGDTPSPETPGTT